MWVRPFPDVQAERHLISVGGGGDPVWSRDGSELFFRGDQTILSVAVTDGPPSTLGQPIRLFESQGRYVFSSFARSFDVVPDDRLLMIARDAAESTPSESKITIVLNWLEELKQLVPVG